MDVNNHNIIDESQAVAWLKSHLSKVSKAALFVDAKCLHDPIMTAIMEMNFYKNLSIVVINGTPGKDFIAETSFEGAPTTSFIHKVIETPIKLSIVLSKKAYLYRDCDNRLRCSNDDQEIGKLLDSIHSHLHSLSW